jgi:hypothetical protein
VLQGARKEAARTKYLAFLAGQSTRPSRIGLGDARPPTITLAVEPFGLDLPGTVVAACSALENAVLSLQGVAGVSVRVKQSTAVAQEGITLPLLGGDSVVRADFSAARIIRKIAAGDKAKPEISKITGLTYGYIATKSISLPIGRKSASGDSLSEALIDLSQPIKAASGSPKRCKVYLQDEEF